MMSSLRFSEIWIWVESLEVLCYLSLMNALCVILFANYTSQYLNHFEIKWENILCMLKDICFGELRALFNFPI